MTTWWSTDKINATISQEYIAREIGVKHQEALHKTLKFGDGLTDNTYLDWALERSPRFFLILNDIGCPAKIIDVIDRSFDDDDLPLTQEALWDLNLFGAKSETLDKKFHRVQYNYIVQDLEPGGHVDYGPWDVVPVEAALKRPQLSNSQSVDRVCAHDNLFTRKKVPLSGDDAIERIQFILHLRALTTIQDPHIVSIFATYSQDDFNNVLLTPSTELTLKQIFSDESKQFKALEKTDRREVVLTWAHCITSALAYLHDHGFDHKGVRLSTILVDQQNKVYLSDYSALKALDYEDTTSAYNSELYEYSPPENWVRKPCLHETAALKTVLPGGSRTSRRLPKTTTKPVENGKRRASTPTFNAGIASTNTGIPSTTRSSGPVRRDSKSASSSGSSSNPRPRNALITTFAPRRASASSIVIKEFSADIFSMSAVLITLLSYLLGHSPKSFASHRGKNNRQAGRGNAPPDTSFHKNLKEVESWMDKLVKAAGQKEKKDVKYWGAVAEMVGVCRKGINKDPGSRLTAPELNKKVGGWVEWGLGRRRACRCHDEDATNEKPKSETPTEPKPRRVRPPKTSLERISYIKQTPARYWTTASEDVSDAFPTARNSYATTWSSGPRNRDSRVTTELGNPSARNSFRNSIGKGLSRALSDSVAHGNHHKKLPSAQRNAHESIKNGTYPDSQRNGSTTYNGMSVQRNSKSSSTRPPFPSNASFATQATDNTEVWGLEGALAEEDEDDEEGGYDDDDDDVRTEMAEDAFIAEVRAELAEEVDDDSDEASVVGAGKKDWPLPMGRVGFDVGVF